MDLLSSLRGGQIVRASFECLDTPDHVSRIYEGDREPADRKTHVGPTYTKISGIPVQDLRGQEQRLNLQMHGFQYLKVSPKFYIHPFEDDKINDYLEEVTSLVKTALKADDVICYDYRFRRNQPKPEKHSVYGIDGRKNWDPTSNKPHIDQTTEGGPRRIRRHLSPEEAAQYLDDPESWRVQIINAWKPLIRHVQDNPITLCDYHTVKESDLVTIEYHPTPSYAGEYYALKYREDQRWFWLSNQTPDEMLLFLSYDSHPANGLRFCPHTAFRNPLAPKDALPRESIEVRMIIVTRVAGGDQCI